MNETYHGRLTSRHEPRRARFLSLRVATLVGLLGPTHPKTRALIGRYWAASGMVPQIGHRLWADVAFATGYARESFDRGFNNRSARCAERFARRRSAS